MLLLSVWMLWMSVVIWLVLCRWMCLILWNVVGDLVKVVRLIRVGVSLLVVDRLRLSFWMVELVWIVRVLLWWLMCVLVVCRRFGRRVLGCVECVGYFVMDMELFVMSVVVRNGVVLERLGLMVIFFVCGMFVLISYLLIVGCLMWMLCWFSVLMVMLMWGRFGRCFLVWIRCSLILNCGVVSRRFEMNWLDVDVLILM